MYRYVEEDPSVSVARPKAVLRGYELYLVEQWACSRQSPTLVIATYTGDERHSIVVGVLSVPADENAWSSRLRVFFKAIQQYHARPKETKFGELMVTNLSSFPSAFTVIPVPGGDIKKHQKTFMVNEDLKRLQCSGRSGLTLSEPAPSTQAKFYQLYKVSDRIAFPQAVLELVKLCQVALFLFGYLDQEYMDGLLCDVTETAIRNWWTEIGAEYYNMEPSDGILGPTTVSALLGTLMGARNRLHHYGAPVSKDVFDVEGTRRGISSFQKYQKLDRTRRLDRQTLLKLQAITAKAAAGEGWGVPKAVKSTVAEFGGKRGEIVMGMVSGKDRGGIGEIETLDIDKFIALASGERAKWLWHGKPRRTAEYHGHHDLANTFNREETSSTTSKRAQTQTLEDEVENRQKDASLGIYSQPPPGSAVSVTDGPGERDGLHKTVFRTVAGRVSDARSGLGRIKGAVGGTRRGHVSRSSKDEFGPDSALMSPMMAATPPPISATHGGSVPRAFTWKNKPEEYLQMYSKDRDGESTATTQLTPESLETIAASTDRRNGDSAFKYIASEVRRDIVDAPPSVAGSTVDQNDLLGPLLAAERNTEAPVHYLHRRHSVELSRHSLRMPRNESRWPRRLSFSDAEEAILTWDEVVDPLEPALLETDDAVALQRQQHLEELARTLNGYITAIKQNLEPWVMAKISTIEALDDQHGRDAEDIAALASQLTESYQRMRMAAKEVVEEEKAALTEGIKEVEALQARLEYEIGALAGRVGDVEDGARVFEANVAELERRSEELKVQLETESWLHWFVRTLTGIGTGPNITRGRKK